MTDAPKTAITPAAALSPRYRTLPSRLLSVIVIDRPRRARRADRYRDCRAPDLEAALLGPAARWTPSCSPPQPRGPWRAAMLDGHPRRPHRRSRRCASAGRRSSRLRARSCSWKHRRGGRGLAALPPTRRKPVEGARVEAVIGGPDGVRSPSSPRSHRHRLRRTRLPADNGPTCRSEHGNSREVAAVIASLRTRRNVLTGQVDHRWRTGRPIDC